MLIKIDFLDQKDIFENNSKKITKKEIFSLVSDRIFENIEDKYLGYTGSVNIFVSRNEKWFYIGTIPFVCTK